MIPTNLEVAWSKRQDLIKEAKALAARAIELDKDRFPAGKSPKISIWLASVEAFYRSETVRSEANALFLKADTIWAEAVMKEKGNVRVEWSSEWNCKLESGEEFLA